MSGLQGAHPHGDSCSRCGDSMEDMNEDGAAADAGDESSGGDSMGGASEGSLSKRACDD
jgi:hypothetical protein